MTKTGAHPFGYVLNVPMNSYSKAKFSRENSMKGEHMKKTCLYILLILFFSGCQTTYKHPVKEAKDLEHDKYECEKVAKKLAKDAGSPDSPFIIQDETERCLKLKFGWTRADS
ncbi:MAG: hypothetical protein AMK71_08310 [Nitrospira bacterium SG8_35_4]|nr:MAG: hypothetical protein AMK71_08310 [Nitrospira bacterium SG8_35_4]